MKNLIAIIVASMVSSLAVGSLAHAAPVKSCGEGRYLVGVGSANQSAMDLLFAAAAREEKLQVLGKRGSRTVIYSLEVKSQAGLEVLEIAAAVPGAIVECDSVLVPR